MKTKEVVLGHVEAHRIERFDRRAKRLLLAGLVVLVLGIAATALVVNYEQPVHRRHLGGAISGLVIGLGFVVAAPGLLKHLGWARRLGLMMTAVFVLLVAYLFVEGGMHFAAALVPWFREFAAAGSNADIGGIFRVVGELLGSLVGLGLLFWLFLRVLGGFRWLNSREARKICGRQTALRAYSEKM
jgi:MFS family permease